MHWWWWVGGNPNASWPSIVMQVSCMFKVSFLLAPLLSRRGSGLYRNRASWLTSQNNVRLHSFMAVAYACRGSVLQEQQIALWSDSDTSKRLRTTLKLLYLATWYFSAVQPQISNVFSVTWRQIIVPPPWNFKRSLAAWIVCILILLLSLGNRVLYCFFNRLDQRQKSDWRNVCGMRNPSDCFKLF